MTGERSFLANYADGLSDVPMDKVIAQHERKSAVASFVAINSLDSFHTVDVSPDGFATRMGRLQRGDLHINGGFFVLDQAIFEYIEPGDELVEKPFERLIAERKLAVYNHEGFWRSMDTFKDKITFDRLEASGKVPWMVWKK